MEDQDLHQPSKVLRFLPQANQLLKEVLLGSCPPRLAFPIRLEELPSFNGKETERDETGQGGMSRQLKEEPLTLQFYFREREPIFDKYKDVGVEDQQKYNIVKLDLEKLVQTQPHSQVLSPKLPPLGEWSSDLLFESRFQSGNLSKAYRKSPSHYQLVLQFDVNSGSYTQWFFFKVTNKNYRSANVTFSIINLYKSSSLYLKGMRVLVFSRLAKEKRGVCWHRVASPVYYYKNNFLKHQTSSRCWNTLEWEYTFQGSDDEVYFAYSEPYTYSDLNHHLDSLEIQHSHRKYFRREVLCHTLAGNRCDLLTISSPGKSLLKDVIVFSARVHPGQTVSSFVMKGIIDFLVSDDPIAQSLRQRYIFKIVPMLNPDGVIHGNYRCNLSGKDLNRNWYNPSRFLHNQIYSFKELIKEISKKYKIAVFCDLHGHSKKKNMFVYGCHHQVLS